MGRVRKSEVAESIPFDNSTNGFVSEDVQAAIEEINNTVDTSASPGFTWGSSGNTTSNTWLLNDSVPSNKAGRRIFLNNATLEAVFISCENPATFDVEVYEHDGTTFTLITTVNVVAARGGEFPIASLPLTTGKELAVKLVNGSAKNPVAGCVLNGVF
jgi:hypothetical protein